MKKKYTKKQIIEAIAYWKKQLKRMNESDDSWYAATSSKVAGYGNAPIDDATLVKVAAEAEARHDTDVIEAVKYEVVNRALTQLEDEKNWFGKKTNKLYDCPPNNAEWIDSDTLRLTYNDKTWWIGSRDTWESPGDPSGFAWVIDGDAYSDVEADVNALVSKISKYGYDVVWNADDIENAFDQEYDRISDERRHGDRFNTYDVDIDLPFVLRWKGQSITESDDEFATRKDFIDAFDKQSIKSEVNSYAEKNSWVGAFAFAYNVFRSAMELCKALYAHEKDSKKKEAIKEMFNNCRDVSDSITDMVGNIADNQLLPKNSSK